MCLHVSATLSGVQLVSRPVASRRRHRHVALHPLM